MYTFLLVSTLIILTPSMGQTLRRPRTCPLDDVIPQLVMCRNTVGTPQTCELSREMDLPTTASYDSSERLRNCGCGNLPTDYYCPMATNICYVPRWRSHQPAPRPPVCIQQTTRREEFSRSIWPVLVVSFACIGACLVCSRGGHWALCSIAGVIYPCLRRTHATYLLRYRPHQASSMIRRWVLRRAERLTERYNEIVSGTAGTESNLTNVEETLLRDAIAHNRQGQPHMLKLRTRIFRIGDKDVSTPTTGKTTEKTSVDKRSASDKSMEEFSESYDDDIDTDSDGCMICFGPLRDGDRIGSLRCKHLFHVNCLKTWLRRRNVCPLCLCEEAAEAVKYEATSGPTVSAA